MAFLGSDGNKKFIVAGAVGVVVVVGVVLWLTWDSAPKTAPNFQTAPPRDVVRFLASENMTKMPAQERFEYVLKLMTENNTPEGRKKYIDCLNHLSGGQAITFRNNMIDVVKFMYLKSAGEYARLSDSAARRQFIDQQLELNESLSGWVRDAKQNPRVKEYVPVNDMQGQFNLLMDRTTPGERSQLETFLTEALQRYMVRETRAAMGAGKK